MAANRLNENAGALSLPAGTDPDTNRRATSPLPQAERQPGAGANSQQAAAADGSPVAAAAAPGSIVRLVDDLYAEGDMAGLKLLAPSLAAVREHTSRELVEGDRVLIVDRGDEHFGERGIVTRPEHVGVLTGRLMVEVRVDGEPEGFEIDYYLPQIEAV